MQERERDRQTDRSRLQTSEMRFRRSVAAYRRADKKEVKTLMKN
jgi:hypothetical protein